MWTILRWMFKLLISELWKKQKVRVQRNELHTAHVPKSISHKESLLIAVWAREITRPCCSPCFELSSLFSNFSLAHRSCCKTSSTQLFWFFLACFQRLLKRFCCCVIFCLSALFLAVHVQEGFALWIAQVQSLNCITFPCCVSVLWKRHWKVQSSNP